MPTIALVPLDDRPCNRSFPAKLARIVGIRLLLPPAELLGRFTTPGKPDEVAEWLLEHAGAADAAVVSTDMLCYGGLIASRAVSTHTDLAHLRLRNLRAVHERLPDLPIYAFSVIMRLSITADSPRKLAFWRDVALYSQLVDRVERLHERGWDEELAAVRERLPTEMLDDYLAVRRRNHSVNREVVRLVSEGVVEAAALCQEDAAPKGLHVPEQQALAAFADALGVSERVYIHPGADEAAQTMLTRAVCTLHSWRPRIAVRYGSAEGAKRIGIFEDRTIAENVTGHIAAAGGRLARSSQQADLTLFVHTPDGPQKEALWQDSASERRNASASKSLSRRAAAVADAGGRVAIADVAYCNGGDPALLRTLQGEHLLTRLAGYAGWNTAGNTIGTALAQGVLWSLVEELWEATAPTDAERQEAIACQVSFLFERFTDDLLYQSRVRNEAGLHAEKLGISPLFLGESSGDVESFVKRRLGTLARELFARGFAGRLTAGECRADELRRLRIRLPWPRTFEVAVDASLGVSAG